MIEQFYPWYWKYYDMAAGDDGGDDAGDDTGDTGGYGDDVVTAAAEAGFENVEDYLATLPAGDEVVSTDTSGGGYTTYTTQSDGTTLEILPADTGIAGIDPESYNKAPIRKQYIAPSTIKGNKIIQGLFMKPISTLPLIGGVSEGNIPSSGANIESYVFGSPGAKFYLEIKDIEDKLIFKLSNTEIPGNGRYFFTIPFPASTAVNEYKINLRAGDKSRKNISIPTTDPTYTIHQRANPTLTFTAADSTISTSQEVGTTDATITREANTTLEVQPTGARRSNLRYSTTNEGVQTTTRVKKPGEIEHIITCTKGDADGAVYVKTANFEYVNSTAVEKRVVEAVVDSDKVRLFNVVDLKVGMVATLPSYTKSKKYSTNTTVRLSDTLNLTAGMSLSGYGIAENTFIKSVNSITEITVTKRIDTFNNEDIVFTYFPRNKARIKSIDENLKRVTLQNKVTIPLKENDYTTLSFVNDEMKFTDKITINSSGCNTLTTDARAKVTRAIDVSLFGSQDVTFTVEPDDIFTITPNAYDQHVETTKDTATTIDVMLYDQDQNISSKTPSIVTNPTKGVISGSFGGGDGVITYTPNTGIVGKDFFRFNVSDGTETSETKTIFIQITK